MCGCAWVCARERVWVGVSVSEGPSEGAGRGQWSEERRIGGEEKGRRRKGEGEEKGRR